MIKEEIKEDYKGSYFLIVGFSKRTGLSCAKLLEELHFDYAVFDERPIDEVKALLLSPKPVYTQLEDCPLEEVDVILLSPGFPRSHELIQKAKVHDIKILGDIDFIFPYLEGRATVGVTGTDGKTTTSALIEAVLKMKYETLACGNNEKPILDEIERIEEVEVIVIELSSFMLEDNHHIKPSFSIITNVAEDHLSRYASFEEYRDTKGLIFKHQDGKDVFLYNLDDENIKRLLKEKKNPPLMKTISMQDPNADYYFDGEYFCFGGGKSSSRDFQLLGLHNKTNALFAIAVGVELNLEREEIEEALAQFKPTEHRMEKVLTKRKVLVINDTKATTVQAASKAIESFNQPIVLILGGEGKGLSYVSLTQYAQKLKKVFTYGKEGEKIKSDLKELNNVVYINDFSLCVESAWKVLEEKDALLLSPACTSFDQFQSYAERGNVFKDLIHRFDKEFRA